MSDKVVLLIENDMLKREKAHGDNWRALWKQAAKKWFEKGEVAEGLLIVAEVALGMKSSTATRRLGLLEKSKKYFDFVNEWAEMDHIEGYAQFVDELAEELGDE
jgi:hypothetical protein